MLYSKQRISSRKAVACIFSLLMPVIWRMPGILEKFYVSLDISLSFSTHYYLSFSSMASSFSPCLFFSLSEAQFSPSFFYLPFQLNTLANLCPRLTVAYARYSVFLSLLKQTPSASFIDTVDGFDW